MLGCREKIIFPRYFEVSLVTFLMLSLQDNDVAILTLNTPAPIYTNRNVKPVCMLSGSDLLEGRQAIVSGWGSLKFGTSKFPSELYSVDVKVWNNNRCNSNYGSQAPGGITQRMLCASKPGKDSCQVTKP